MADDAMSLHIRYMHTTEKFCNMRDPSCVPTDPPPPPPQIGTLEPSSPAEGLSKSAWAPAGRRPFQYKTVITTMLFATESQQ